LTTEKSPSSCYSNDETSAFIQYASFLLIFENNGGILPLKFASGVENRKVSAVAYRYGDVIVHPTLFRKYYYFKVLFFLIIFLDLTFEK
jgi:hypothetical protein